MFISCHLDQMVGSVRILMFVSWVAEVMKMHMCSAVRIGLFPMISDSNVFGFILFLCWCLVEKTSTSTCTVQSWIMNLNHRSLQEVVTFLIDCFQQNNTVTGLYTNTCLRTIIITWSWEALSRNLVSVCNPTEYNLGWGSIRVVFWWHLEMIYFNCIVSSSWFHIFHSPFFWKIRGTRYPSAPAFKWFVTSINSVVEIRDWKLLGVMICYIYHYAKFKLWNSKTQMPWPPFFFFFG